MTTVSVIIPVYNGEEFIERAVRSALAQTGADIEVVAVDDGSKDATGTILDTLAVEDNRVRVIHTPNGGVNAARTTGICNASGEWLCFLDADDTLPEDAIKKYSQHFAESPDIIVSGISEALVQETYIERLLQLKARPELWAKMFSATLLKEKWPVLPREIVMGEDLLQNLVIANGASGIATIPELLYAINLQNGASVTKTFKRSQAYEEMYFGHFDRQFPSKGKAYECLVYWLKLSGMKTVVLQGGSFDCNSAYWKDIVRYFAGNAVSLGLSEKLLLKAAGHQRMYRAFMNLYLSLR